MRSTLLLAVLALPASVHAQTPKKANTKPEDAPTFQWRVRVTSVEGKAPAGKKFTVRCGPGGQAATVAGDAWSNWLPFTKEQMQATLAGYPAQYLRGYPIVVRLSVGGVVDPTAVEAEVKFDETGEVFPLRGELFGPNLGILLSREDKKPRAATMAQYNRRYWKFLEGVKIPEKERPKLFPIVDRFIGGDDDRIAWREGIDSLNRAGFSVLMLPPSAKIRELLLQVGGKRTSWAVYSPPGYAFAFEEKITPQSIQEWADKIARPYLDAGYAKEDMALFALSDEPGWYYPRMLETLKKSSEGMKRFRAYLQAQKLQPADVGAASWDEVQPVGRSQAKDLPGRRLFYWTMRFFAHDSARHFAQCTAALEKSFYPGLPVLTNWNFFAGRLYVPGPVANNPDKQSPDAAMGGHDWLEFGKLRGGTMLWTEDWFGDARAYQWSFYCARLRCAAQRSGVEFGGYVVPRTAGDRDDGILQRILCLVGSGGRAVKYFVFGPEYNFPGNCYSERARVLPKMAEAHRMIGAAEDLLWHGRRPQTAVALLAPRSAQMWDAHEQPIAKGLSDATNTNLNGSTVDYLAEVFDLYLALQHANIPVDFVDEDDLTAEGLKAYRVLYVTAPNIPAEGQRGLAAWVKAGGTLVTVSGAGQRDRYDEPCSILADALGIHEQPRKRLLVPNAATLKPVGKIALGQEQGLAVGVRGAFTKQAGRVLSTFADGAPAVVEAPVGKGLARHFAFLPGISYWVSARGTKDKLPVGFSADLRRALVEPVAQAKIEMPVTVSTPLVEAPMLVSNKGAAVTLLNWTGEALTKLDVVVRVPFTARSVTSVRRGTVPFSVQDGAIRLSLPVEAADILMLRP